MCIKFDLFMMSGYKDMIDVIFKNGHKAASRLIDHAEKGKFSIPKNEQLMVKNLVIDFLVFKIICKQKLYRNKE